MSSNKEDTVVDEFIFLKEQLTMVERQQQLQDEIESLLLKMRDLAEYRKTHDLYHYEITKLNAEMKLYEQQYHFLLNYSNNLYLATHNQ